MFLYTSNHRSAFPFLYILIIISIISNLFNDFTFVQFRGQRCHMLAHACPQSGHLSRGAPHIQCSAKSKTVATLTCWRLVLLGILGPRQNSRSFGASANYFKSCPFAWDVPPKCWTHRTKAGRAPENQKENKERN